MPLSAGSSCRALAIDILPGFGEVALAATGIYLSGDYLYQHWTPFRDVANDVGHATVTEWTTQGTRSIRPGMR